MPSRPVTSKLEKPKSIFSVSDEFKVIDASAGLDDEVDPFTHRLGLSWFQVFKTVLMSVTIAPLRLVAFFTGETRNDFNLFNKFCIRVCSAPSPCRYLRSVSGGSFGHLQRGSQFHAISRVAEGASGPLLQARQGSILLHGHPLDQSLGKKGKKERQLDNPGNLYMRLDFIDLPIPCLSR